MKRALQLTLMIIVFVAMYALLNYYVVFRTLSLLGIEKSIGIYVLFLFLTFSFIISMILEKFAANRATRAFYIFSSVWMGIMFITFSMLLLRELIDLFFNIDKFYSGIVVISVSTIFSVIALIQGNTVKIKKIEIWSEKIKKDFKIVQLSDLHLGTVHQNKFLKKIVDRTNSLNPDVVMLTGDLIDGSAPINANMISEIDKIKAPVFYVIGNHEIYEGLENIMPILENTKMKILRNKSVKWEDINFIGIDYSEERGRLLREIKRLKTKGNNLLLYHAPELKADVLDKEGIFLHLAGHTHGGQIWPFSYLVKLVYPYLFGLHKSESGKANVYVSQGTATWGPPMRLFTECEITILEVKKGTEK